MTKIGLAGFSACSKISSIEIPSSVTEISDCSFSGCTCLKEIVTDEKNPVFRSENGVLYSKDMSRLIAVPTCKDSIQIPESVIEIGDWAFYGCSSITSVEIPNGVKSIGKNAFSGCTSLASIRIPNRIKKIGDSAFSDCTSLTSIEIPGSVRIIKENAFDGCTSLTEVHLGQMGGCSRQLLQKALHNLDYKKITIYVPIGSGDEYRNDTSYREFKNVIEE